MEAAPCSDCHEQCGDTRAESDVYECLFWIVNCGFLIHHTVDVVTKTTVEICIYLKLCADMLGCDRPVKTTVLIDSIITSLLRQFGCY